jgi:hypothetical protein
MSTSEINQLTDNFRDINLEDEMIFEMDSPSTSDNPHFGSTPTNDAVRSSIEPALSNPSLSPIPDPYAHDVGNPIVQSIAPTFRQMQQHVAPAVEHPHIVQFQDFLKKRLADEPSRLFLSEHMRRVGGSLPYFGTSDSLSHVMAWSMLYLVWMSVLKPRGKSCVVFDIDDTLLTRTSKKGEPYDSAVIEPVFKLYQYALSLGLSVYIVTARPHTDENLRLTKTELDRLGISVYDGLFLMPMEYYAGFKNQASPFYNDYSNYKYQARRWIQNVGGKEILLTTGDNWADMLLDHSQVTSTTPDAHAHADVSKFVETCLPENMYYILKVPDVAMMAVKLLRKPIKNEMA